MSSVSTTYLGIKLRNPLVVASSSLSGNIEKLRKVEDSGAGAVVLKSLFEEQIDIETKQVEQYIDHTWHTEAYDYVRNMGMQLGPEEYLRLLEQASESLSIPVFASLNCVSEQWWLEYASKLESAGAVALELNISYFPLGLNVTSEQVENRYCSIVRSVTEQLDIPVSVKIGPNFTALSSLAQRLCEQGAAGLVLFNRFYQIDIDIEKLKIATGSVYSSSSEISRPLRWIAVLSNMIDCDLGASTGVHDSAGMIKLLLAGADIVEVCSVLYEKGLGYMGEMLAGLEEWMKEHDFESLDSFKGLLSRDQGETPELLERLQYIKALTGIE